MTRNFLSGNTTLWTQKFEGLRNPMGKTDDLLRGRYRILKSLGEGSFSTVYLVEDPAIPHVHYALKEFNIISLPEGERPEAIEMFRREAQLLQSLNHPGLPGFVDSFSEEKACYLMMEYVEGENLDALV